MIPVKQRKVADEDVIIAVTPTNSINSDLFPVRFVKNSITEAIASTGKTSAKKLCRSDSRIFKLPRMALTQIRKGNIDMVRLYDRAAALRATRVR